jgi:hypothetical protein
MAIRPTDLQSSLIYQTQAPPIGQRAEEAPRIAQQAAQAAFINQTDERNEKISEARDAQGNRIDVRDRPADRQSGGKGGKRPSKPGEPFGEVAADGAGDDDGVPHLIDYTA